MYDNQLCAESEECGFCQTKGICKHMTQIKRVGKLRDGIDLYTVYADEDGRITDEDGDEIYPHLIDEIEWE